MKVFLLSIYDVSKSGGLSTYVQNLANAYQKDGDHSVIITPNNPWGIIYSIAIFIAKALYVLNKRYGLNLYYYILGRIIFLEFIKQYDPNYPSLLHFQDVLSLHYVSSFLKKPIPKILTLHGDLTNMNLSDKIISYESTWYTYSYFLEKSGYLLADKIVAVDERLRKHALWFGVPAENVFNFPNFTDTSKFFRVSEVEKKDLRLRYHIPLDKKIIFCPRRLVEKNGVIYAVDTISQLGNEYILIITGEWGEKDTVMERMEKLRIKNRVILTGDVPNSKIREYYCLSDMVIIPSISSCWVIEATSISAIEGMACGVPVIASNIGWLAELIQDGSNSFLAEEKNADMFASKIENYFDLPENEREKVITNAMNSVEINFSSESYIRKLKKLINL